MEALHAGRALRVYQLRDEVLEHLEGELGQVFEGLAVAARAAKQRGLITARTAKVAERIDICYNALRHLTEQKSLQYLTAFGVPDTGRKKSRVPHFGNGFTEKFGEMVQEGIDNPIIMKEEASVNDMVDDGGKTTQCTELKEPHVEECDKEEFGDMVQEFGDMVQEGIGNPNMMKVEASDNDQVDDGGKTTQGTKLKEPHVEDGDTGKFGEMVQQGIDNPNIEDGDKENIEKVFMKKAIEDNSAEECDKANIEEVFIKKAGEKETHVEDGDTEQFGELVQEGIDNPNIEDGVKEKIEKVFMTKAIEDSSAVDGDKANIEKVFMVYEQGEDEVAKRELARARRDAAVLANRDPTWALLSAAAKNAFIKEAYPEHRR